MKKIAILILTFVMSAQISFSQFGEIGKSKELSLEVHGKYTTPITKRQLTEAKLIKDLIQGYPINWISKYVSVEIIGSLNGKKIITHSKDGNLNSEQMNLLSNVDIASNIFINVNYLYDQKVGHQIEKNVINYSCTVVPDKEAAFAGGYNQLIIFLKENAVNKIPANVATKMQVAKLRFTIDEAGWVEKPSLVKTTGDLKTDNLILKAIQQMPQWLPAKNEKGNHVKQEFEFVLGNFGC